MKKLFMIVSTPFWMLNVDSPQLNLLPPEDLPQLQKLCSEFEKSAEGETDARALDFSRRLHSAIFFQVSDEPASQKGLSLHAEVSELQNLQLVPARDSLSLKSTRLGLPTAGIEIEKLEAGTFLKVAGLDLACDLAAQRMQIKAEVPLHAGPASEILHSLNEKLGRMEKTILGARSQEGNVKVAAALLGFRLSTEELKLAYNQLLNKKNLELTDNWETFGGVTYIRYEKNKDAGIFPVTISVPNENEIEIRKTERMLAAFSGMEIQDFSPEQRQQFSRLNEKRARLLRKMILQKIQRRKYAL